MICFAEFSDNLQLRQLNDEMLQSRRLAFAKGTYDNLKVQWKAYLLFCAFYTFHPFDALAPNLCYFAQFLSRTFKSVNSIKNYLNGVRILFLLQGINTDIFSSFELKLTLRGLKRKLQHLPKQALPITLDILSKFHKFLDLNSKNDSTFWCICLFAFFLLARKSNLVPVSSKVFSKDKQLCRSDIEVHKSYLLVRFKWSKTIQYGDRQLFLPLIGINSSIFCPVTAYKQMCILTPASGDSPAFLFRSKKNLVAFSYYQFEKKLKDMIRIIGLDPSLYSSHSFRRGGASLAAQAGISSEFIQIMGDWKSDAYKQYIVCSLSDRFKFAHMFKKFIMKTMNFSLFCV